MKRLGLVVAVLLLVLGAVASGDTFRRGNKNAGKKRTVYTPLYLNTATTTSVLSIANPIPSGSLAWCVTVHGFINSDWGSKNRAAFIFGTEYNNPNAVMMSQDATTAGINIRVNDSAAGFQQASASVPLRNPRHKLSLCMSNRVARIYIDGALAGSATALASYDPAGQSTIRFGDYGSFGMPWGSSIGTKCISGPKTGITSGSGTDPRTTVAAACGEFTAESYPPCYGCVTPLPGAEKVVALGDSITAGGSSRTYPEKLNALLGTSYNVTNGGVPGEHIAAIRTRWLSTYRNAGYSTLVLLGGANDITQGATAVATWATTELILNEAKADGMRVIPVTMTPWKGSSGWTVGRQTETESYNTLIRNWCTANSATCVDAYVGMADTVDTQAPRAIWFQSDKVHPNQAGQDQLATLVRVAFP